MRIQTETTAKNPKQPKSDVEKHPGRIQNSRNPPRNKSHTTVPKKAPPAALQHAPFLEQDVGVLAGFGGGDDGVCLFGLLVERKALECLDDGGSTRLLLRD